MGVTCGESGCCGFYLKKGKVLSGTFCTWMWSRSVTGSLGSRASGPQLSGSDGRHNVVPMPVSLLPAAQQEAQRAQFLVEKAKQEQKQKIVQAEGEATAAKMISCFGRFCGMCLVSLTVLRVSHWAHA